MFVSYWFFIFAVIFFSSYWFCPIPIVRKFLILIASMTFHFHFAGPAGVLPIIFLGINTYFAGLSRNTKIQTLSILLCIGVLIFYKYTIFIFTQIISFFSMTWSAAALHQIQENILPIAPPLAISFFVFEFIHYLADVQKGKTPIQSPLDFILFAIFWPSVVAGPIKRFDDFLINLSIGYKKIKSIDIQLGLMRITMGLIKKLVIADNLTGYIDFWYPQFGHLTLEQRWVFLIAISMRILFDFSGYSDIAIGFARLMGITLPENFSWPYIARNLQTFWRRWHISLSTWIRDYIYIPLGGNQHGIIRKILNGMCAFSLCGLWHGASGHFIVWGLYHGLGLAITTHLPKRMQITHSFFRIMTYPFSWVITFIFVSIGWLYFFYPIENANTMIVLLFKN